MKMKSGWEVKKLGEVCEIVNGGTPKTKVRSYWGGDNLWITPKDMGKLHSKFIFDTARKITSSGLKNSSAKLLPIKSIVLSTRAPIGYVAINSKPLATNQGCKGIIPTKNLSTYFLYYFLISSVALLNTLGHGTTFKELSSSVLANIPIPLPPLAEQERIVAILDQAFAAIAKARANTQQNLANARELFDSTLNTIFTHPGKDWEEKNLEVVCKIINGGTPDTKVKKYWGGHHLWITPKDMGKLQNIYVEDTVRKITDLGLKNSSAKILPMNSIILSSRAPIGHLAINKKPLATNQGCKGIVPEKIMSHMYLYYFLKKSVKLLNDLGSGTTFKELSSSKLSKVTIPFPPLAEQQAIVTRLDALSAHTQKLATLYQKKLAALDELKSAILQKAFNGEL